MSSKTSIIWSISHDEFQKMLNESSSMVEILRKIGFKDQYNGNHRTLSKRIQTEDFDLSLFKENAKNRVKNHFASLVNYIPMPDSEAFAENSNCDRQKLKKRIIAGKYKPYICNECSNAGEHNGKPLNLQLDHINGIANDNRLDNLRFLCPNCHSQTSTFSGRKARKFKKCARCKIIDVPVQFKRQYCDQCLKMVFEESYKKQERFTVEKLELEKLVQEKPMTEIGKMFGVSDNAIRKRCKKLGIGLPKNRLGYWTGKN